MAGSIQKIWPWKAVLETRVSDGKTQIVWGGNIWPEQLWSSQVGWAVTLAVIGFMAVLLIERLSRSLEPKNH